MNVKAVRLLAADAPEAASYGVSQKLTVNARAAGPRLGKDVQQAIKGSKSGDWSVAEDGTVTAGGLALAEGEYTLETVAGSADEAAAVGVLPTGGFVVLDTAVTPELAAEGLARDLVRAVQQARRDAGLDVSDRIALTIGGSDAVQAAARTHEQLITDETLATSYDVVRRRRRRAPGDRRQGLTRRWLRRARCDRLETSHAGAGTEQVPARVTGFRDACCAAPQASDARAGRRACRGRRGPRPRTCRGRPRSARRRRPRPRRRGRRGRGGRRSGPGCRGCRRGPPRPRRS